LEAGEGTSLCDGTAITLSGFGWIIVLQICNADARRCFALLYCNAHRYLAFYPGLMEGILVGRMLSLVSDLVMRKLRIATKL
jgi:hypothetical protein